jgi:hypothetical protein
MLEEWRLRIEAMFEEACLRMDQRLSRGSSNDLDV